MKLTLKQIQLAKRALYWLGWSLGLFFTFCTVLMVDGEIRGAVQNGWGAAFDCATFAGIFAYMLYIVDKSKGHK